MQKKRTSVKKVTQKVTSVHQESEIDKGEISQELDAIFKTRWHGAINIRGIRYQILYSLLRAFDLYIEENSTSSLRLEGIEDIDLLDFVGFQYQNEYVQVKSADTSWNWSKLKDPLEGFLKVSRTDPSCGFVLAVSFPLTGDIEKLTKIKLETKLESLTSEELLQIEKERLRIEKAFNKLCNQVNASDTEASDLLRRLTIISISEEQIWQKLKTVITNRFNLGSEAVDTYISALVAKFLEWAKDRKTVTCSELENVRISIGEALAREKEFQAYGQGLINRVSWIQDASLTDFFDGKGTRSGHIVAGLDIVRSKWLEKIDAALTVTNICILRASSGQGKSTLLYRYAYENRTPENTFVLRVAETPEQVELIRNYLQFRASLGLPVLLLIDDARWQTRLWASVAQQCAALGIRVLVTVRDEDWHRFAQESLIRYEILEPRLELEEAKQIFKLLKIQKKVHISVNSPEWAYEKIGEPYLLMEYVYLLTQGRMLEERLRDQVRQITQQQEDPAKIEILRRTALAHALGTPVILDKLLQNISFTSDPQQILKSLLGEYLQLEQGMLTGLHWVRSNLLAQILHEVFPNPASTALAIFEAVPSENLAAFISNAICREGLDSEVFMTGLIEKAQNVNIETILNFLNGLFEAGERKYFEANRAIFDEGYKSFGSQVPFLLSINLTSVVKVDSLSKAIKKVGQVSENFRELHEIESRAISVSRGINLCQVFLNGITIFLTPERLKICLDKTGQLLDWCCLCQVHIPVWQDIKDTIIKDKKIFYLPIKSFCSFTQGLYRYDESAYQEWFVKNRQNIICYVKLHNDCIELELSDDVVSIKFFPDAEESSTIYEQTVSRLDYLRSAIPFCQSYQSQGIWLLPFGMEPCIDETNKNIVKEYLQFKSDTSKEHLWFKIVQNNYLPDSCYKYQESWFLIRNNALILGETLLKYLKAGLSGRTRNSNNIDKISDLIIKIDEQLRYVPLVTSNQIDSFIKTISSSLKEIFKQNLPDKWYSSFSNYIQQLINYLRNEDISTGRSLVHNFKDANKHLSGMHDAFKTFFQEAPDYFEAAKLDSQEIKTYAVLADLLEVWILNKPLYYPEDILQYIQSNKESKRLELIQRIQEAITLYQENGISFILPNNIYTENPLRYLPIAFSVADPCYPEVELFTIISAIPEISDVAEIFCLIPTYQGKRFLEGSYHFSSTQIAELLQGNLENWETLMPRELAEGIWECLPEIEFCPNPRRQFRESISGLMFGLEMLYRRKEKIELFKDSQNTFEIQLYNKHINKLIPIARDLENLVDKVNNQLILEFSNQANSSSYITLNNFIASIKEKLQQVSLDDLLMTNSDNIANAVDQLLRESLLP